MMPSATGPEARSPGAAERALCLMFRGAADAYALPALDVLKVVEPARLNRLPRLPPAVLGITHHRGRIITVVDLASLLGAPRTPPGGASARVLVLDRGQRNIGLYVDAVDEIVPIRVPAEGRVGVLTVVQHQGRALSALDTERVLERIYGLTREEAA